MDNLFNALLNHQCNSLTSTGINAIIINDDNATNHCADS